MGGCGLWSCYTGTVPLGVMFLRLSNLERFPTHTLLIAILARRSPGACIVVVNASGDRDLYEIVVGVKKSQ